MTKSGPPITTALRCFTCGYTNADDHLCIDDPISVQGQSIVTCSKKYCTIQRQELQTPAGKVQSFVRDCQEVPPVSYRSIIITPFTEKLYKNIYNWHNVLVFIAIVSNVIVSLSLSFLPLSSPSSSSSSSGSGWNYRGWHIQDLLSVVHNGSVQFG